MLKELHLKGVGPADQFDLECADRLNILTGDNGLGKSFLLDIIWWCVTGRIENPTIVSEEMIDNPEISYHFLIPETNKIESIKSQFKYSKKFSQRRWISTDANVPLVFRNTLAVYIRVDGGISVFISGDKNIINNNRFIDFSFSSSEVWNGRRTKNNVSCYGLIDDWIKWQNQPDQTNFQLLSEVINQLSATDETIEIGKPTRISLNDIREIPTIKLPYDTIPITHASAGMKRILSLAYILVWMQSENLIISKMLKQEPAHQLIFLMDEVESHLHPRWQRSIVPAILKVVEKLQQKIDVQAFITTHSPLVLASVEPIFDEEIDKLFLFELNKKKVTLEEIPWTKQGDVIGWLTSEIFGLKQARSKEAEQAIEAAQAWMRKDSMKQFPDNLRTKEGIHQQLITLLPGHDPFFPRWIVNMEKNT
jgi:ABC-type transport system involved in cytochrome c biogenesis ATPase subunit